MEISTGMMLPRWPSVAALYCLTKSMMLTPCGPSAVPTGGAGVAAPALSWTLTTALTFFFLGAISSGSFSDLAYLIERKLYRGLPAEYRHQHLELLRVRVDLADRGRQRGERPVHHGHRLVDLEVHGLCPHRLCLLGRLLLGHRREQRGDLVEAERRRPARQADEPGHARGVADGRPRLVGQVHPHQDVAGQHLLLHLLPLAAFDLDDLVGGHLDLEDVLLHVQRLGATLQVGPDPVLVAGVGVHDVPVAWQPTQISLERRHRV